MVDPPSRQTPRPQGATGPPAGAAGTAAPATSDPAPATSDRRRPDLDRSHPSTSRTPPSDQPASAPQPPVSCASPQSARPAAARQAAGRARTLATGTGGLAVLGLAGAALLTAASYLATTAHPRGLPALAVWLPGTLLLAGAWLWLGRVRLDAAGPPGLARPRPGRWPVRLVLATGLPWAVVLLASAPLASRDGYAYACQGTLVTHGVDPYTNGIATLPCPWLSSVPSLWWHTPTPYGPLWLLLSGGAAAGSGGHLAGAIALLRLVAVAGVALTGWAAYRLAGSLGVDPAPALWLAASSPLVLVHAVSGVHNDALLAGFVVAAFAVAARRGGAPAAAPSRWAAPSGRAALAGVLLGLAVGVKATALVALPFVVLLVAGDARWGRLIRTAVAAGLGLVAGYAVFAVPSGYGLGWLPALSGTAQLTQWTSLPTGVGMTFGYLVRGLGRRDLAPPALDAARAAGLLALAVALVALWLWARRRVAQPRLVVVAAGLAMTATVLLAPVAFPWYLLAPLAVLGCSVADDRRRYRLGLGAAGLALLVLPDGTGLAALTKLPGALLDTALVITAVVVVLRRRRAGRATPTPTGC